MGEIVRAMVFERFSSLSLGYGLTDTWLAGLAPVIGSNGLSWLGFWMTAYATATFALAEHLAWGRLRCSGAIAVVVLVGWASQQHHWTTPSATPVSFRLIQPNITQDNKFAPEFKTQITNQVIGLLTAESTDVVVTPETAFPMYWHELPGGALSKLQNFANHTGSHLIFGVATTGNKSDGHNSMMHIDPGSGAVAQYNKVHLFPFGEYAPLGLGWITDSLAIPMKDLSPGTAAQMPFQIVKHNYTFRIGTLICQENMLSDEARAWAPHVEMIINPSNMAWFDGTLAMAQSLNTVHIKITGVGWYLR